MNRLRQIFELRAWSLSILIWLILREKCACSKHNNTQCKSCNDTRLDEFFGRVTQSYKYYVTNISNLLKFF